MKIKILIVTVFITNIAFASSLPIDTREIRDTKKVKINQNITETLTNTVSEHLYNKGLDKNVASERVSKSLVGDEVTIDLMAMNLLNHFPQLKQKDIIAHISQCALFNKSVDLSAHDHILSLLQQSYGLIMDKQTLSKVKKVSLENRHIQSIQS
jgi:hypothetical protein